MPKRILGLEVSEEGLKYALLYKKGRTLVVYKTGEYRFSKNYFKEKDIDSLVKELQQVLFYEERIKCRRVCLSFSSKQIVLHEITLPKMSSSEIEEVIKGELERIPLFSREENFLYTYYTYPLENVRKNRVIYVGISKELLNFYIQIVKRLGLHLEFIEITPLNLLNFFYPQLEKNKNYSFILLEESLSYILIFQKNNCILCYTANTGFRDIFKFKNKQVDNLIFNSWADEIKRIYKFFETEYKRSISEIFLIWNNQILPDLNERLSQYLGRKIDTPFPSEFLDFSSKMDEFNYKYLPVVSSVVRILKETTHEFNLERIWSRTHTFQFILKTLVFSLVYILAVGGAGVFSYFYFQNKLENLNSTRKSLLQKITFLERKTKKLEAERQRYLMLRKEILKQATFIKKLNRISWSRIFAEIGKVLPADCWIRSFHVKENGEIIIEGYGFSLESVAGFIKILDKSKYLDDVKFTYLKERKIKDKPVVNFGLRAIIKVKT